VTRFSEKNSDAIGILEIEGIRFELTSEKIEKFFDSELDDLQPLKFSIVIFYPVTSKKKPCYHYRTLLISTVTEVSLECPDKPIILATLHKIYEG
jgi:hypothetical protein